MNIHLYDVVDAGTLEVLQQIQNTIPVAPAQKIVRRSGDILSLVESIIKKDVTFIKDFLSGSFFTYTHPNLPHCDHLPFYGESLTVILPLFREDPNAHLLLWNQTWHKTQMWDMLDHPVYQPVENEFSTQLKDFRLPGFPGDYNIENHTHQDVPENLREYLPSGRAEYYGMSGNALPFTPGSIIMFNSRFLSNIGRFSSGHVKGLTLRFRIENNDKKSTANTN